MDVAKTIVIPGCKGSVWERGLTCVPKKFEFFFFAKI
jgi:hypothetical protein